jgi:hypothetical protein
VSARAGVQQVCVQQQGPRRMPSLEELIGSTSYLDECSLSAAFARMASAGSLLTGATGVVVRWLLG